MRKLIVSAAYRSNTTRVGRACENTASAAIFAVVDYYRVTIRFGSAVLIIIILLFAFFTAAHIHGIRFYGEKSI